MVVTASSVKTNKIIILDFGSQYTQLIARRIRQLGVYTEVKSPNTPIIELLKEEPKGIVLSGGPQSVGTSSIDFDSTLLDMRIPLLGICYGMQLMNHHGGGRVERKESGEYGAQEVEVSICDRFSGRQRVWMSHRDSIIELAEGYEATGMSDDGIISAIKHKSLPHWGVQFHPEVTHTENGERLLDSFLDHCGCDRSWSLEGYIDELVEEIREQVGEGQVMSLVSGGVDSTVSTILAERALGSDKVIPLYIDTGLMRKGETEQVVKMMSDFGLEKFRVIDASGEFMLALEGVESPEEKRKKIGDAFVEVVERELARLGVDSDEVYFCQGTLYTDLIESGKGCGDHAEVIKSHHNVNPPSIARKRREGLVVEPNKEVFKDEVRALGEILQIPHEMLWRHPFPGPGLAIRVIGEVTEWRVERLRKADAIFLEELHLAGLYEEIWQAFAVILPVTTVGVMGDCRTEGEVIGLRAITSEDGMTAEIYEMPYGVLQRVSSRIVNEVEGVNRVVYDVTSKPPATVEWE